MRSPRKSSSAAPKPTHRLTVLNRHRDGGLPPVPDLRLSGRWLASFGFVAGRRVTVHAEHASLRVTFDPAEEIPPRRGYRY
jgi:hypothetical protein